MYALSIDCGEFYIDNPVSYVKDFVFYYLCNATVTDQDNETNSNVTELLGMHMHGWNSSNLHSIALKHQNLTTFPVNIVKFSPHLKEIVLSFNSITRITKYHLKPFRSLGYLVMDHNQISYLEYNLFHGISFLYLVDFSYNNIKHMVVDASWPLVHMDFRNNLCINESLSMNSDEESFICHIRNKCAPPQPTTKQPSDISESANLNESASVIDHTQVKGPEPGNIRANPPYPGEDLVCLIIYSMGKMGGKEISDSMGMMAHKEMSDSMGNKELSERCKLVLANSQNEMRGSLSYVDPDERGHDNDGPIIRISPSPFNIWSPIKS